MTLRNPKQDPVPGDILLCALHGEVRVQDSDQDAGTVYVYWPQAEVRGRMPLDEWCEYWAGLGWAPDLVLAFGGGV